MPIIPYGPYGTSTRPKGYPLEKNISDLREMRLTEAMYRNVSAEIYEKAESTWQKRGSSPPGRGTGGNEFD